MGRIPRAALDYLTSEINGVSDAAKEKVRRVLERLDWEDIGACRQAVVDAVNAALDQYALAAAVAAADFYDASREAAVGAPLGAVPFVGRKPEATEEAVKGFAQKIVDGRPRETFDGLVLSRIDYEVKRAAGECMTRNAARDPLKPRFARVPSGSETCRFCLMLASRGFVYSSKGAAGGVDHWHPGCDCRVVCSFDGSGVEGYRPADLYDEWQDAEWADARERAKRNGTKAQDEYDKRMRQLGEASKRAKSGHVSKYEAWGHDFATGEPLEFHGFGDVEKYLGAASSQADLERRYNVVGKIYGFGSEQMQARKMKDALRRIEGRFGGDE